MVGGGEGGARVGGYGDFLEPHNRDDKYTKIKIYMYIELNVTLYQIVILPLRTGVINIDSKLPAFIAK